MKRALIFVAVALWGCQAGAQSEFERSTDNQQALDQNIGRTMALFMERTGLTPINSYDTNEGRVFLFDPSPNCCFFLVTKQNGAGLNADGWTISRAYDRGRCFLS